METYFDKSTLKPSTLKTYRHCLNSLFRKLGQEPDRDALRDFDKVETTINSIDKINTRRMMFNAILFLFRDDIETKLEYNHYQNKVASLNNAVAQISRKQEKTESQVANWFSLNDGRKFLNKVKRDLVKQKIWVRAGRKELTPHDLELAQRFLVMCLYLIDDENPPLRNEYRDCRILQKVMYTSLSQEDLDNNNYLVIENNKNKFFHLGKYKTKERYGIKHITVGKKLNPIINMYLSLFPNDKEYLIVQKNGLPLSTQSMAKYVAKSFENLRPHITSGLLRHIVISEKFPAQLEEKEKLAWLMNHSTTVAETNYAKK